MRSLIRRKRSDMEAGLSSEGNRLTLYVDGDEAFQVAYEAIQRATYRVWLETYILEPDEAGQIALQALTEAAERGCDVILMYDGWGSPHMQDKHVKPLLRAGGDVTIYNPNFRKRKWGKKIASRFHRDHRKILIIDDMAFTGGRNVSKDYGGPGDELFYDLTLKIEGPASRDLASILLESFEIASSQRRYLMHHPDPKPDGVWVDVLSLDARKQRRELDDAIRYALDTAERSCRLATPYFIPPGWFLRALGRAARRGIDLQILTAGRSDVPVARLAGQKSYGYLLRRGIRIYELQNPILHAKYLTMDGRYSIVGSYNIDRYGSKHNLEVGVATLSHDLAQTLEAEFDQSIEQAKEVTLAIWKGRPLWSRVLEWVFFQLSRI